MKTYSNNKPKVFEAIGDGGFRYNYNIKEVEVDRLDITNSKSIVKQTQWEYDNVLIYPPIDQDKITRAVISNTWDRDFENKLINDYNAISLGVFSGQEAAEKLERYREFLDRRKELKEMINQDYQKYWVSNEL